MLHQWGPTGALFIHGAAVRGGNIIDLVNYAIGSRKAEPPQGLRQFARALQAASIPKDFLKNN